MAKLCSEPRYQKILQEYVDYIRDEFSQSVLPRFEDYSFLARKLPFFVYDNPAFVKKCKTGFTDFRGVYINKNCLLGLMKCDEVARKLNKPANYVTFLLLHEVAHCLKQDDSRLHGIPHKIANIAQDISNNLSIQFGFSKDNEPLIDPRIMYRVMNISWYGVTPKEQVKFGKKSSETIGLEMYRAAVDKFKLNPHKKSKGPKVENQEINDPEYDPTELDDIDLKELDDQLNSPMNQDCSPELDIFDLTDENKEDADSHVIGVDEIADMAKEGGLPQETIDALGLNEVRTREEIQYIEQMNKMRAQQSGFEMQSVWDQLDEKKRKTTRAGTEGGFYEANVNLDGVGRITWKMAMREITDDVGTGMDHYTEDELMDEFYANPALYDGVSIEMEQQRGILLSLIDTSGSMSAKFIDEGFSECLASVDSTEQGCGVKECLIFPADVDVKGQYWALTEYNQEQVKGELKRLGGGGTDFTNPLKNALLQAQEDEKRVTAVVFITDLGASTPDFEYIKQTVNYELPPIIFVTDNQDQHYRNEFERECKGNALVFYYDNAVMADIEEIQRELDRIGNEEGLLDAAYEMDMS
jgi:hypothetical protein